MTSEKQCRCDVVIEVYKDMKKILLEKVASSARNQTNLVGEILHSILLLRHC